MTAVESGIAAGHMVESGEVISEKPDGCIKAVCYVIETVLGRGGQSYLKSNSVEALSDECL